MGGIFEKISFSSVQNNTALKQMTRFMQSAKSFSSVQNNTALKLKKVQDIRI